MRAEDCSGDFKSADTAKIHLMALTRLQKIKELKMNEEIYANSGITTDNTSTHSDDSNNYEDIYANEDVPETGVTRSRKGTVTSGETDFLTVAEGWYLGTTAGAKFFGAHTPFALGQIGRAHV